MRLRIYKTLYSCNAHFDSFSIIRNNVFLEHIPNLNNCSLSIIKKVYGLSWHWLQSFIVLLIVTVWVFSPNINPCWFQCFRFALFIINKIIFLIRKWHRKTWVTFGLYCVNHYYRVLNWLFRAKLRCLWKYLTKSSPTLIIMRWPWP